MLSFAKRSSCICARIKLLVNGVSPPSPTGGLITSKIILVVFNEIVLVPVVTNVGINI